MRPWLPSRTWHLQRWRLTCARWRKRFASLWTRSASDTLIGLPPLLDSPETVATIAKLVHTTPRTAEQEHELKEACEKATKEFNVCCHPDVGETRRLETVVAGAVNSSGSEHSSVVRVVQLMSIGKRSS